MRWLTRKQVKAAAKRGRKSALKCSYKHWHQISTATIEEFEKVANDNGFVKLTNDNDMDVRCFIRGYLIQTTYCALCLKYYNLCALGKCPMNDRACFAEWIVLRDWLNGQNNINKTNLKEFRRLAHTVRNKIGKVYKKLYKEEI